MVEKSAILVVDDEPIIFNCVAKAMDQEELFLDPCTDGHTALEMLSRNKYDLVILDIVLPSISGLEVLPLVTRNYPEVPVIVTTGYSTFDNAVQSLRLGAFDYIPKPFSWEDLKGVILRALRYRHYSQETEGGEELSRSDEWPCLMGKPENCFLLGMQTWARIMADDTAVLGVSHIFPRTAGRVLEIELPYVNETLVQGGALAKLLCEPQVGHTVWAPLSGRVLEVNTELNDAPSTLNRASCGSWLARLETTSLTGAELENLRPCPES